MIITYSQRFEYSPFGKRLKTNFAKNNIIISYVIKKMMIQRKKNRIKKIDSDLAFTNIIILISLIQFLLKQNMVNYLHFVKI